MPKRLASELPNEMNDAPVSTSSVEAQLAAARMLNGKAWTVFGGSSEVQKNIIAKTVLGL